MLAAQMAAADYMMYEYGTHGVNWDVPGTVMNTWLPATVVQLIGVVFVVTRYPFPRQTAPPDSN